MIRVRNNAMTAVMVTTVMAAALALATTGSEAKDKVKVGFIGPLTGGVSANGIGGRNSADLAVRLRNADASAKYEYETIVLDDECKPDVGASTRYSTFFRASPSAGLSLPELCREVSRRWFRLAED